MSKIDFFTWFESDFLGATEGLEPEARLLYRALCCYAIRHGFFPTDPRLVARITGIKLRNAKRWIADIQKHVTSLIEIEPGKMTHPKIVKQRAGILSAVEKKAERNRDRYEAEKQTEAPTPKAEKPRATPRPMPNPTSTTTKSTTTYAHKNAVMDILAAYPLNSNQATGFKMENDFLAACAEMILTLDQVQQLHQAVTNLAREWAGKAEVCSLSPANFVRDQERGWTKWINREPTPAKKKTGARMQDVSTPTEFGIVDDF